MNPKAIRALGFMFYWDISIIYQREYLLFHSLFKLEQPIFLVKLLWHVRVRVMLVEELDGMES